MPLTLLPASAAAFAPRSAPTVVLNSRVETWLTQTLKRVNRTKRPLNSVPQHFRCLTDILSGAAAIWSMASIIVPKAPDSLLRRDPNLLVEALANFQFIHIEAYVVHVDMVSQNDVAFKLTPDSIKALIAYHKDIYSIDVAASTWNWSGKEQQLKKLHEDFVQAVNKYVFRTDVRALEGMEDEGAGELLEGRSQDVKNGILGLFLPLLPPPPRVVDVLVPAPLMAGTPGATQWWQPTQTISYQHQVTAAESWRVLGSSHPYSDPATTSWMSSALESHLPSPAPSYHQPVSSSGQHYMSPQGTLPRSVLPMPSVIAQQCGTMAGSAYGGFAWSHNDTTPQYPIYT